MVWVRICSIGPFAGDVKAAPLPTPEDKSIDACYTSYLKYEEALASKWMERMTDLGPS
jgi:hypothetical protein